MEEFKGEGMNVLSLFDGISCGLQALKQAGTPVTNYYASEVDKYAIQIAKKNHPEIIELGDVTKWKDWDLPKIDLLIGGSPCQGFSMAGKQLNFDDPRSALFFEYVEILWELKPKYFLLENVKMKKEYQDVISGLLGVEPILINSALVSAQNRKRLYWSNLDIDHPGDKGIYLKDVLQNCDEISSDIRLKSKCLRIGGRLSPPLSKQEWDCVFSLEFKKNYLQWDKFGKGHGSQDQRAYYLNGKHGAMPSSGGESKMKVLLDKERLLYRRLSAIECERLQTLPDNYTLNIPNGKRYNALGNGWTVSVIEHIFNGIK